MTGLKGFWIAVAVLWAVAISLPPTEITVYPLHCTGMVIGNRCESGDLDFAGNTSTYTASPRRQEVFHSTAFGVERLEGCKVMTTDTWTCRSEDADGYYAYNMNHGSFRDLFEPRSSTSTLRDEFIHVSGWQYYLHAANAPRKDDFIGGLEVVLLYAKAVWTLL